MIFSRGAARKRLAPRLGACLAVAAVACLALLPRPATAATAAPAASSAVTVGKTTVGQVEAYVRQQAAADHVPGTAVGIVEGSRPVLLSGFGDASASTSFFLGSLSKSFTALAVMQLASAGKVNLDAPVRRYIPSFKVGDGSESDMITVRQLLDQTSGISNKAGLTELSFAPSTTFTQAIDGFEAFPLTSPPGQKFQYSDANYTIAGYVVQQVSGQSYDSYVQQHIFAPLGMTHTYAMTGVVHEPGLARGYANWLGLKVPLTDQVSAPLVPAGYIISSASDMTHYLTAEMNGGVYNGTRILPAQAVQETHAPLTPVDGQPPVPGATSYGLGWGVGTVNGAPVIVHDGQLRDFDTAAAILPEGKTAVVLLMNQDPELVVNDDSLYNGLMQGITTGRFPAVSHSFVTFYAVLDTLVLATLVLMIASFWRTGRWLRKFRVRASRTGTLWAAVRAVGLDLVIAAAIAAAVVFGLGAVTGYVPLTPTLLIFAAPDLAIWLYAIIAFFVVRAIVRAICISAGRGTPQPVSPGNPGRHQPIG